MTKQSRRNSSVPTAAISGAEAPPKPPYVVPTMGDLAYIPPNGFNAISTFSGCGGSSLGYKMAGYRVLWANEFVPAAAEVYRLNHPETILNRADIRTLSAGDILKEVGLNEGDLDLLDGSPPCAAFSVLGNRDKEWGQVKAYSGTEQRVDDLFFEYIRLLKGLQPKTFVAENVTGLVKGRAKGRAKGYFMMILDAFRAAGYRLQARILNAQWLGVPQARERLIFVGVRNDLDLDPVYPTPLPYFYTVRDALTPELYDRPDYDGESKAPAEGTKMRELYFKSKSKKEGRFSDVMQDEEGSRRWFNYRRLVWHQPSMTIIQGSNTALHPEEPRTVSISELKRLCGFPDDFKLTGSFAQKWERLGRAVPPPMMYAVAKAVEEGILCKAK